MKSIRMKISYLLYANPEDGYTSWAGKPTCKSNHQGSTESDSEDSDDRPYKRRRRSDPGVSARTQLQAEQNYREHRSDALRWLSKVVFGNPSDKAVCEVIESAIIMIHWSTGIIGKTFEHAENHQSHEHTESEVQEIRRSHALPEGSGFSSSCFRYTTILDSTGQISSPSFPHSSKGHSMTWSNRP
ncbi:hypothetical protein SISSUDRAFT_1121793 [Sistotremastrum suecicum HHB10207 ss-3]|uniref:Uncharacterized protein n=1 Tax=Sistotremastrum suecicum HHB10207 ss-3 TaxID=1314776 RepID=A0A166ABF4_9AGAM|nr:hypothetical protein SISSUDRAFT_1121793 [Sistotremastrum suecicum HHB10207 ss-3]